jgi:penicillin-binding protein 1A
VWFLFGLLGFTAVAGAVWVATQVPLPSESPLAQTTIIYDKDGKQLAELHGVENRYPVKLEEVPLVAQAAVIAAEDRNFLQHRGIDPVGIARATWADIRNEGFTQGGSTITQQYVKNQFVGSDRTLVRKLKEAVIAVKLERKYDKRTILEKYLNTVYFGRGAYGMQAAAKTYFDKDVGGLDLKESAYLAGLIRTPSDGDVYVNPESAYYLRTSVLRNMVKNGSINQPQADEVEKIKIESYVWQPERADTTFTAPVHGVEYFVEYVRQKLVETYGEDRVLRGGLRVHTTLDLRMQELAYDSVYGLFDDPEVDPAAALVAIDPEGRVVAMVGGRDWNAPSPSAKVNLAVGTDGGGGGRQAGSSFKPFVLAEAINQGISLDREYFSGANKRKVPGWGDQEVANYEGANYGHLNLVEATVSSVNTVYAELATKVGPENVVRMANDLGIKSELEAVPSIALGTQNVSVLEMANAYNTFRNDGMRSDPRVIAKVADGGSVLVDDRPTGRNRAIPREVAQDVKSVLGEVVSRGTGIGAQLPGGAWGKTGTSEEYGDAWFVGGNDKLITSLWMGYPEGQSRPLLGVRGVGKVAGGTWPAYMFRTFMSQAAPGEGPPPPRVDPRLVSGSGPRSTVAESSGPDTSDAFDEEPVGATTIPSAPATTVVTPPDPVITVPDTTPATQPPPVVTTPNTVPFTIPDSGNNNGPNRNRTTPTFTIPDF